MGETVNTTPEKTPKTTDKSPKKSWWKGLKAEFKKIIWPDRESLTKQSLAVVVATLVLGVIISLLDTGIKFLIDLVI